MDNYGTLRNYYQYRPFGIELKEVRSAPNHYEFTGKEQDEELNVQWNYFGARYYDPDIRRFISADPLSSKYPGWSPYVYALDNPMKYVDPDGELALLATVAIGAGVGAALGAGADAANQFSGGDLLNWDSYDFSREIDWTSVAIGAGEGAILGGAAPLCMAAGPAGIPILGVLAADVGMLGDALRGNDWYDDYEENWDPENP